MGLKHRVVPLCTGYKTHSVFLSDMPASAELSVPK
jgi:hypothetical protein